MRIVSGFSQVTSPMVLWDEYCSKRGLTPEILDPMKGQLRGIEDLGKIVGTHIYRFKSVGAVAGFVYPVYADYYQCRLLYDPDFNIPVPTPDQQIKPPKQEKYIGQSGAPNFLYVPPHLTDWDDPQVEYDLLLVEGALNAVRLASAGYHAVALQGVANIHIGSKATPIIPELKRLVTAPQVKSVTVLFDSDTVDLESNRSLFAARMTLSQKLIKLRAPRTSTVYSLAPPAKPDGGKNGPDDYLQDKGVDEFNRLLRTKTAFEDDPYLQALRKALDTFIYDTHSGRWFHTGMRQLITGEHANDILATFGKVLDITSNTPKVITLSGRTLLVDDGLRRACGIRYQPDVNDIFFPSGEVDGNGEPIFHINKFQPEDVVKPIKGDITIALDMLSSICRDSPSAIQKILTVAAYHAQNPALTPKYGLLFTGDQRAGKSNMARLIGLALSRKFNDSKVNLKIDFNSEWRGVACKEWPEFDRDMDEEWLKDLITGSSYMVSVKYGTNYTERNHTLNIFTCNGLESKVQEGDKRFVIAGYARGDNQKLGLEFERWVNGLGPAYFRHFLLNEVDASGYDTLDIHTEMRGRVIDASKSYKSSVKDEIVEMLESVPDLEIIPNCILKHLLEPYRVNLISFIKSNAAIFTAVYHDKGGVKINGTNEKFRAFKNHDKWAHEQSTELYRKQFNLAEKALNPARNNPEKF